MKLFIEAQVIHLELIIMPDATKQVYREFTFVDGEPVEDGRIYIRRAGVEPYVPSPSLDNGASW